MTAEQMAEMQWLQPRLVAQINFTEWTRDSHLRHGDYLGLRLDKEPADVVRERRLYSS
jgi:bifunctional non-homologous end joining protein LigD